MSKNAQTMSFTESIKSFFDSRLAETLHTCLPARIEAYDSKTRKAKVLPLIKKQYLDDTVFSFKPIENVPVMFYGVNNASLRLPEKEFKGQTCLLIFSERSLENWLSSGDEVTPGSTRKFDLSDAIAILSLNSFNNTDKGGNDLTLQYGENHISIKENGSIDIKADNQEIEIDNGQGSIILKSNGQVAINGNNLTIDK